MYFVNYYWTMSKFSTNVKPLQNASFLYKILGLQIVESNMNRWDLPLSLQRSDRPWGATVSEVVKEAGEGRRKLGGSVVAEARVVSAAVMGALDRCVWAWQLWFPSCVVWCVACVGVARVFVACAGVEGVLPTADGQQRNWSVQEENDWLRAVRDFASVLCVCDCFCEFATCMLVVVQYVTEK